jgi:hypothetical protein
MVKLTCANAEELTAASNTNTATNFFILQTPPF